MIDAELADGTTSSFRKGSATVVDSTGHATGIYWASLVIELSGGQRALKARGELDALEAAGFPGERLEPTGEYVPPFLDADWRSP